MWYASVEGIATVQPALSKIKSVVVAHICFQTESTSWLAERSLALKESEAPASSLEAAGSRSATMVLEHKFDGIITPRAPCSRQFHAPARPPRCPPPTPSPRQAIRSQSATVPGSRLGVFLIQDQSESHPFTRSAPIHLSYGHRMRRRSDIPSPGGNAACVGREIAQIMVSRHARGSPECHHLRGPFPAPSTPRRRCTRG